MGRRPSSLGQCPLKFGPAPTLHPMAVIINRSSAETPLLLSTMRFSAPQVTISWLVWLFFTTSSGFSFQARTNKRQRSAVSVDRPGYSTCLFVTPLSDNDNNNKDDTTFDKYNPVRDESSQMPDYIASYLDKNNDDSSFNTSSTTRFTHLIAVPVDENHELTLELESVQRAILYHCPLLVHACIVPAVTRMPLLYVQAPKHKTAASVTRTLHDMVERLVDTIVNVRQESTQVLLDNEDDEDELMGGVNSDGYKPLLMNFANLEIDGPGNQVLSTVGDTKSDGRLEQLTLALKQEIEGLGWKVSYPPDDHVRNDTFRPRVPFMRLPDNFVDKLDPLEEGQEDWMRTSDQGGNGISPIFWCQWWEDTMAKNMRLREISVYPRQPNVPEGLGEDAFYIPHETTLLPTGNDALTKAEARHQKYNEERMAEVEGRTMDNDDAANTDSTLREPQVRQQRERLESIFAAKDAQDTALIDEDIKKEIQESLEAIDIAAVEDAPSQDESVEDSTKTDMTQQGIDDWTKERIRKTVEARAFVQAQKIQQKDKPNIEDNEVFQKYKSNTLVDKKVSDSSSSKRNLPDYPSREYFFGIWRVVTPPTGFPEETGDDTKSDNIILRVDGTIAGGPTLDQQTNQKAAGGTWKMIESTDDESTKLRIRLVIPPKKERILIMEGEVTRFMSGTEMPLSKSTFGIPELEAAAQKKNVDMEDLMHCGGPVWIEDAVTGKNREEIGAFSLMKLQSPLEPGKYSITIPRPVRSQD